MPQLFLNLALLPLKLVRLIPLPKDPLHAYRSSTLSLNLALKPLTSSLGGGLTNLFAGLGGKLGGTGGDDAGDVSVQPFAKGGVIASPSFFPLGSGRTGLAGEAGPEAIMPLARGPDGRLGVAASGGAAQNVTVNIATADAESFRRSELTGLIARAVARNRREPSAKGRRGAQRAEPPERKQEDVLHQVIHFVRRHASQQDTVHHAPVAAIERLVRHGVSDSTRRRLQRGPPLGAAARLDCGTREGPLRAAAFRP